MRKSFPAKTVTVAATSFLSALLGGTLLLTGMVGANAAETTSCHIAAPTSATSAYGNEQITWTGSGNCEGVTIDLVSITDAGETVLSSDDLTEDATATFTYGTLVAGSSYEFRIHGKAGDSATPIVLKTVTA